jgi:hypothetical protein
MKNVLLKFEGYSEQIQEMTKFQHIETVLDIESIIITYDSKNAIVVH